MDAEVAVPDGQRRHRLLPVRRRPVEGPDGDRAAAARGSAPSTTCGSRWIIDIGFPGPDRGEGGKYLLVPPGYDGPLPEGGFFVAHSKTNHVLYAARVVPGRQRPEAGGRELSRRT